MGQAFVTLVAALFPALLVLAVLSAVVTEHKSPTMEAARQMPAGQGGYVLLSRLQPAGRRPAS